MNVNEIIGNNLKKYRSAYNMTLNELSERLHKSISTISKYEKGSIAMDIPTFLEISQIFQISPSILLSGAFTLVIMILPLIMRTAEEALKSVPDSYRGHDDHRSLR